MDAAAPHEHAPPTSVGAAPVPEEDAASAGGPCASASPATAAGPGPEQALPIEILDKIAAQTAFPRDLCNLAKLACKGVRADLAGPQRWPELLDRWLANRARRSCLGWRKALVRASTAGREHLAVELLAWPPPDLADAKRSEAVAAALDAAAEQDHRGVVAVLLDAGCECVSGQAIRVLLRRGHSDLVQRLLQQGRQEGRALPTDQQAEGALLGAIEGGHVEVLRLVLEDRRYVGWQDSIRPVVLAAAAAHGHGAALHVLLASGWPYSVVREAAAGGGHNDLLLGWHGPQQWQPSPQSQPGLEGAVLAAAASGHLDTVRLLVEGQGAMFSRADALTAAARGGHTHVLGYLLTGHRVDAAAVTAAALGAAECGHADVLELLLARRGVKPEPGQWPLAATIRAGRFGAVGVMLARGAPPTEAAMCAALSGGHVVMVQQLLAAGGTLRMGPATRTVEHAAKGGCVELVQMVLDLGIKPTRDALYFAIEGGHNDVLQMLLQHGGGPVEAIMGRWALELARMLVNGREWWMWVLLEHGGEAGLLAVLEVATRVADVEFVQLALERFGDEASRQRARQMARVWAAKQGHKDVLRLLRPRHW